MVVLLLFLPFGIVVLIGAALVIHRYTERQIQNHPSAQAYRQAVGRGDIVGAMQARQAMNEATKPLTNKIIWGIGAGFFVLMWLLTWAGSK